MDAVSIPNEGQHDGRANYISTENACRLLKTFTESGPMMQRPDQYPEYKVARLRRRLAKEEQETLAGVNVGPTDQAVKLSRMNYPVLKAIQRATLSGDDAQELWKLFGRKDRLSKKDKELLRDKGVAI